MCRDKGLGLQHTCSRGFHAVVPQAITAVVRANAAFAAKTGAHPSAVEATAANAAARSGVSGDVAAAVAREAAVGACGATSACVCAAVADFVRIAR